MTGGRLGWMLLVLPVLVAPLLPHAGVLGPSLALAAALLATATLLVRAGVLQPGPAACTGVRPADRVAGEDRLRTPIRSCDPDGRSRPRPSQVWLARLLPYGLVVSAAVVPLALTLVLVTSSTWMLAERAVLRA